MYMSVVSIRETGNSSRRTWPPLWTNINATCHANPLNFAGGNRNALTLRLINFNVRDRASAGKRAVDRGRCGSPAVRRQITSCWVGGFGRLRDEGGFAHRSSLGQVCLLKVPDIELKHI
jgi:hypothetical protein